MTSNQTRILLGDGVVMEIDSWDQLPSGVRQELRKLGAEIIEASRLHQVAFIQIAPKKNLREAQK